MNEVRLPTMHAVIVALMAQGKSVGDVVTKGREVLDGLNVMRFKTAISSAMLACVIVPLEDIRFPSKVLGAASSLRLLVNFALGNALTCYAAVNSRALSFARSLCKRLAADFASVFAGIAATFLGAIDATTNKGLWSLHCLAACGAIHHLSLGLCGGAALTGAVSLERVGVPVSITFFGDDYAASLAVL